MEQETIYNGRHSKMATADELKPLKPDYILKVDKFCSGKFSHITQDFRIAFTVRPVSN